MLALLVATSSISTGFQGETDLHGFLSFLSIKREGITKWIFTVSVHQDSFVLTLTVVNIKYSSIRMNSFFPAVLEKTSHMQKHK